jgi:hypothetical protein
MLNDITLTYRGGPGDNIMDRGNYGVRKIPPDRAIAVA